VLDATLRGDLHHSISSEFIAEYTLELEDILVFVIAWVEKTGLNGHEWGISCMGRTGRESPPS